MNTKMTRSEQEEFNKAIRSLPAMYSKQRFDNVRVTGQQAIDAGHDKLPDGSPICPNALYQKPMPARVNHRLRCEELFRLNGMAAVRQYCDAVHELFKTNNQKVN